MASCRLPGLYRGYASTRAATAPARRGGWACTAAGGDRSGRELPLATGPAAALPRPRGPGRRRRCPAGHPAVCPVRGDDLGRWLARQREASAWAQLSTEQRERLSRLGVRPLEAGPIPRGQVTVAAARSSAGTTAFALGVACHNDAPTVQIRPPWSGARMPHG
ncbi:helicase associated domain-containing protein [Streptomyces althioticus]|uniref:helicase associated domain-containing protein n=1 Tax=Streptomyces althioticus TaxID=83380 RepID=UPI003F53F79B